MQGTLYERDGRWLTIEQLREYNAKKNRKQVEASSNKKGTKGEEKESVHIRDNDEDKKEKEEVNDNSIVVEVGKEEEDDGIFQEEEETDSPEPTLAEIKSKPKKKK